GVGAGPAGDDRVRVDEVDRGVQQDGVDRQIGDVGGRRLQQAVGEVQGAGAERAAGDDAAAVDGVAGRHDQVLGGDVGAARVGVVRVLHHQGAADQVERARASDDAAEGGRCR